LGIWIGIQDGFMMKIENQMDKGKFQVTGILWSLENNDIFSVNEKKPKL
jgi:hypothetical protein